MLGDSGPVWSVVAKFIHGGLLPLVLSAHPSFIQSTYRAGGAVPWRWPCAARPRRVVATSARSSCRSEYERSIGFSHSYNDDPDVLRKVRAGEL